MSVYENWFPSYYFLLRQVCGGKELAGVWFEQIPTQHQLRMLIVKTLNPTGFPTRYTTYVYECFVFRGGEVMSVNAPKRFMIRSFLSRKKIVISHTGFRFSPETFSNPG